jgi:carbonic anhydrase
MPQSLHELFENNRRWARQETERDPAYFERLLRQQVPAYLWIGCSDSRVPANQIAGLSPGEVFVHRNVGNVVVHTDLNCLSVIDFAVTVLNVKHILVVGHYGCAGVKRALEGPSGTLSDNWVRHIQDVLQRHEALLAGAADEEARYAMLCELNVIEQAANVCRTSVVQDAWRRNAQLHVHAWIYSLSDGLLRGCGFECAREDAIAAARSGAIAQVGKK